MVINYLSRKCCLSMRLLKKKKANTKKSYYRLLFITHIFISLNWKFKLLLLKYQQCIDSSLFYLFCWSCYHLLGLTCLDARKHSRRFRQGLQLWCRKCSVIIEFQHGTLIHLLHFLPCGFPVHLPDLFMQTGSHSSEYFLTWVKLKQIKVTVLIKLAKSDTKQGWASDIDRRGQKTNSLHGNGTKYHRVNLQPSTMREHSHKERDQIYCQKDSRHSKK